MTENITENAIADIVKTKHQDGVLWKASRIWSNTSGNDPDSIARAIEELTDMLIAIKNETKRSSYIAILSNALKEKFKNWQDELKLFEKTAAELRKKVEKLQQKVNRTDAEDTQLEKWLEQVRDIEKKVDESAQLDYAELKESLLKQSVKDRLAKRKADLEAAKSKAAFDKKITSADDAGMPAGFSGNDQDIYDAIRFGIYEMDGMYYSKGAKGDYEISDFTMNIIYHAKTGEEEAYRLATIKNIYGFEHTINFNTDDLTSVASFKKVIQRRGVYNFKGGDADLTRLMQFLQRKEIATRWIDTLGWQKSGKFWAWGNGITTTDPEDPFFFPIDKNGMVEYKGKKYLIPACAEMYADKDGEFTSEKQFVYTPPIENFGFEEWAALMIKVYNKRAIPGILHYISVLFRDIIYRHIHKFPLLNLFGPPASGKSEMGVSLMSMFGLNTKAISLEGESTNKSYMRKIAQVVNGYTMLEEYKNNQQKHIGSLKNIYDGLGYDRAKMTNDNQTKQTPVNTGVMLLGQEMPTIEAALFTRVIMTTFDGTGRNREAFIDLKAKEKNGLGYITAILIKYRQLVEQNFSVKQPIIQHEIAKEVADNEVSHRLRLNISILLTMLDILKDRIKFPFSYADAKAFLIDGMMTQHHISQGSNNVARWWQIVELLFVQGLIRHGRDFALEEGYLYIRIMQVHPLYIKEMHMQRDPNFLAKTTLEYYLRLDVSVFVKKLRKRFDDGSNQDVYQFKYGKLGINLIKGETDDGLTADQRYSRMMVKYNEMGLDRDGNPLPEKEMPMEMAAEPMQSITNNATTGRSKMIMDEPELPDEIHFN